MDLSSYYKRKINKIGSSLKFPEMGESLHLLPFSVSSPTGVGAFVEPKIITRRHVDFRIKETKMPLRCIRIPKREQPVIIVGQVKGARKR